MCASRSAYHEKAKIGLHNRPVALDTNLSGSGAKFKLVGMNAAGLNPAGVSSVGSEAAHRIRRDGIDGISRYLHINVRSIKLKRADRLTINKDFRIGFTNPRQYCSSSPNLQSLQHVFVQLVES